MTSTFKYLAIGTKSLLLAMAVTFGSAQAGTISTGDGYPPFTGSKLDDGGVFTRIVDAALTEAGIDHKIEITSWTRAYEAAKAGKYAATFGWFQSDERAKVMYYSDPIFTIKTVAFMKAGALGGATKLADLKGKTVCTPKGYTVIPEVQALLDAGSKMEEPKDLAACLKMVKSGRADVIVDSLAVGKFIADAEGMPEGTFEVLPEPVTMTTAHFLAPKSVDGSRELVEKFNAALKSLQDSGKLEALQSVK